MLLLLSVACSSEEIYHIEYFSQAVTPFALEDVNASSASFGEIVSTTDFPEKISAWYFGHST